ncbi:MAG: PASTA domain-containing protein [Bacteroidaceae bacterium]|nr:PASTA domain-containing protein [Bacteroidaceae bacterium]
MKKRTKRIILINFIAMALVVVATPFVVLNWLDSYTLHGRTIEVPNICGMSIDEGAERLKKSSLGYEIVDYKYQKGAAENEILEQRPVGASRVKKDRKIHLTLNSNKEPTMALPDVVDNCSLREAVARLRAAGFKLTPHDTISGEKDWVYSVKMGEDTLRNGAHIAIGSTLTLVVGSGKEVEAVDSVLVEESWFE